MNISESRKRLEEASNLLVGKTTSAEKLESLNIILKGLNPKLDQALKHCAENFSKVEKLQSGDVISLTAESLPENSEEEKRRKKAILALIRSWEDLKSEVERVKSELDSSDSLNQQAQSAGRIMHFAKGPFGLITAAAVLIVGFLAFTNLNKNPQTQNPASQSSAPAVTSSGSKIKVIIVDGKKIPLTEVKVVIGPECDRAEHYHAINGTSVIALDGSTVADPGSCGYGKTAQVAIVEQ